MTPNDAPSAQPFYHGTKVDLKDGDLIGPGYVSNHGKKKEAAYVYLTATLDAAIWSAELALGTGPGRIYVVEPTGPVEDDPNLTDKKFPGNRRSRTVPVIRFASWAKSPTGTDTRPSSSRP